MDSIFDSFFSTADSNFEYVAAGLCADIAKNIESLMKHQKISNVELAEKLECTKSYVTKLLRGDQNLSVKTLAKISIALDAEIKAAFIPKSAYAELNRQIKEYFVQQHAQQRQEAAKKSWMRDVASCNDDTYGTIGTLTRANNVKKLFMDQINAQSSIA